MPVLDLPDSPYTLVWKQTLEILRSDPGLARLNPTWIVPDGSKSPNPLQCAMPVIELDPYMGGMGWFDPSAQSGFLTVGIRTYIKTYDSADPFNLFAAIVRAFFPKNEPARQNDIRLQLIRAGATDTGQYEFSFPPTQPDPRWDDEGLKVCAGQMRISIVHTINP